MAQIIVRPNGSQFAKNLSNVAGAYDNNKYDTASSFTTATGLGTEYVGAWLQLPATKIPGTITQIRLNTIASIEFSGSTGAKSVMSGLGRSAVSGGNYGFTYTGHTMQDVNGTAYSDASEIYSGTAAGGWNTSKGTNTRYIIGPPNAYWLNEFANGTAGIAIRGDTPKSLVNTMKFNFWEVWIEIDYTPYPTSVNLIRIGDKAPDKVLLGSNEVSNIYIGSKEVYSK